jgi:hypothetical protein
VVHLWPTSTELTGGVPLWTGNLGIMRLHAHAGFYRRWLHQGLPDDRRRAANVWPASLPPQVVQSESDEPVWLLSEHPR